MIGCFPDLHEEETLNSGIARYVRRMKYRTSREALIDLFGKHLRSLNVGVPRYVEVLVKKLPPGHSLSTTKVLNQHSLFKLYQAFDESLDGGPLRDYMLGASERRTSIIHRERHLNPSGKLRYCPECVRQDQQEVGEAYWHRVHQAPGVLSVPAMPSFSSQQRSQTLEKPPLMVLPLPKRVLPICRFEK
jgi:hypothetical protein